VADVRSSPYSRWLPQYNRPELQQALGESGIAYLFLGDRLGGRPEDSDLYDDSGRVDYERVRQTEAFRQGLEQLCQAAAKARVAMLCAEEDPLDCHRGLMIAPALAEYGISLAHLRADGRVESTEDSELRLLETGGLRERVAVDLFGPPSAAEYRAVVAEAYRRQARRRAFRLRGGERFMGDGDDSFAG
jgi:uncharacterized protein (DUF488 family)